MHAYVLLDVGASDVGATLKIQTYCTGLVDILILNELLNLSRKCAVERDDVASIRSYNCNMTLTVNFACADQTFADICLPALDSHSIPIISRSLHPQAATVGDEFSSSNSVPTFANVSVPIFASNGNAEVLILHKFDHGPVSPVVFQSHSVNLADSPLNVGGFPRPLMSTRLCRSLDRGGRIGNGCLDCLSHRSQNLRQSR